MLIKSFMAANIQRNIETSKHFGGLFKKKGGDIAAATAIDFILELSIPPFQK